MSFELALSVFFIVLRRRDTQNDAKESVHGGNRTDHLLAIGEIPDPGEGKVERS